MGKINKIAHKKKYENKIDRIAARMCKQGKLTDAKIIKRIGIDKDILEITRDITRDIIKDDPTYFNCK